MVSEAERERARERAVETLTEHDIEMIKSEARTIEVTDFGLGRLDRVGLALLTYVNTDRDCAKELVMFPEQICPERHGTV